MAVQPVPGERVESLLRALPRGLAPRFSIPMGALGVLIKLSADVLMASIASVAGMVWAQRSGLPIPPVWMMSCYAPLLIALFAARSAYRRKLHNTLLVEFMSVQTTAALAAMMLLAGMVVTDVRGDLGDTVAKVWLATAALLPIGRLSAVTAKRDLRRRHRLQSRTLIVGNGVVATHLAQRFTDNPQYGILPVGLIDADPESAGMPRSVCTLPPAGTPATMAAAIRDTGAEAVVVAFSQTRDEDLVPAIRAARLAGLTVWVVPRMFDAVNKRSRVDYVGGMPVLDLSSTNPRSWQFTAKHVADRMLAAVILLVIAPLFAALAVAVRVSSQGPVLPAAEDRPGRDRVRLPEVPLDALARGRSEFRAPAGGRTRRCRRRRPAHRSRPVPAQQLARRASAADQCDQGGHEPGRPASRAPGIRGAVQQPDPAVRRTSSRQGRDDRMGAGARPAWPDIHRRPGRVGQLLHRKLVAGTGSADPADDGARGAAQPGAGLATGLTRH
ncbi:hypothetical protein MMUR_65240 [Mycolicibacterium murale]|uniref:UDP-phosphate galactose phosphotransferase n=1 Tax=Mycolicibacterium murale TaxID=182220 RepID=A0A7I9WY63_9MYCO|nr:hypothetical protein [Mycolicibacterium murale]MCV7182081.1 hypothetical protein [Mycolicibacterium murale]GFG62388.1 hypothetical protein MMUR_65240 [Mycolicibacterium murale]